MTLLRTTAALGFVLLGLGGIPTTASAQSGSSSQYGQGDFGVGLMIGSPTGLTAKQYLAEQHALDAALGFGYGGTHFHADYLYEKRDVLGERNARLGWFVGIGGQFSVERNRGSRYYGRKYDDYRRDRDYFHVGPRVPLGLELRFQSIPKLEFFGELALGFEIVEYPGLTLDGGIGTRFYF